MNPAVPSRRGLLLIILLVALGLRVSLALQGGQYFFGDESRHTRGLELYLAIREGDGAATCAVLAQPEHAAFTWLVAGLAPVQHALAALQGHGDWRDPNALFASAGLGAALLAALSVIGIALIYQLARAGGAGEAEALLAAGLMAASNTLLYTSRHLLPYDAALTAWLGSLVLVQRGDLRAVLGGGLLAGITYHLYNGYWFLVPASGVWCLMVGRSRPQALRLGTTWGIGAVAGLALPVGIGVLAGGASYWATLRAFSGTVVQGLFAEGWSLPWAYLWHSEQALGLLVLAALAAALATTRPPPRIVGALAVAAAIYGLLCLMSAGLERFVVYGRTVRPLVPLLCLAGGWALGAGITRWPRLRFVPVAAIAGLGLVAALAHYGRAFPREIELRVLAEFGFPKHALSFSGSIYRPLQLPVARPELALVDAQLLYPVRDFIGVPAGTELFSVSHPLAYAPYQYEGHTPRERRLLRDHPPRIRLLRLSQPELVPEHPPATLLFSATDRPDGRDGGRR
jgi:hypothetical protein